MDKSIELIQQEAAIQERLELLRTLKDEATEKSRSLALDTLDKVAPLAEELGLHEAQQELQELSMQIAYPDEYKEIHRLMQEADASCQMVFQTFKVPICAMLDSLGIEHKMIYRMKSVYSIWRKMKKDNKCFDEVYDLFAARIIYKVPETVKPLTEIGFSEYNLNPEPLSLNLLDPEILTCWRIYTVITALYRVQPDRIKDWITHPKPSGYQALQMTCMGPDCNWIEIQVRSERMDYDAEYGNAAHWKYKKSGE